MTLIPYFGASITFTLLLLPSLVFTTLLGQTDPVVTQSSAQTAISSVALEKIFSGVLVDCTVGAVGQTGDGPSAERCEKRVAWLKLECETYYNSSKLCRDNRSVINNYLSKTDSGSIDIKNFHDYFQTKVMDSYLSYERNLLKDLK